jgi:hypothetical protein
MRLRLLAFVLSLACAAPLPAQSTPVPKTNPIKIYMHYMPWFQTPVSLGGTLSGTQWGWHWTMNDRNPNIIDPNGQREIASNDYPLIGPYDSSNPYVIEYHMLLMKLCGVDGVIVDWYGTNGTNGDIKSLLSASNTIVSKTANYGLQFGVCLEDRFAASTSDVSANLNYLQQNYFSQPNYIRAGPNNQPLTLLFGPETFKTSAQWNTIMAGTTATPALLPLQYQEKEVGSAASGEFAWVYQDPGTSDHLTVQQNFLTQRAPTLSNAIGVAYPGYNDYYAQGGAGAGAGFTIPYNNGQTLSSVLSLDQTYSSKISAIQLATWNDFGEGTMLEPTVQDGFTSLLELQQFTGVGYGLPQLEMVYQLYEQRVACQGNPGEEAVLDQAASDINNLDFASAQRLLSTTLIPEPAALPLFMLAPLLLQRRFRRAA